MAREKKNNARDNWCEIAAQISSENEPIKPALNLPEESPDPQPDESRPEAPAPKAKSTVKKTKKVASPRAKTGAGVLSPGAIAAMLTPELPELSPVVELFEEHMAATRRDLRPADPRLTADFSATVSDPAKAPEPKAAAEEAPVVEPTPEETPKPVKKRRRAKPADEKEAQEEDKAFGALLSQIASVAEPAKRKTVKRRAKSAPASRSEEAAPEAPVEPVVEPVAEIANEIAVEVVETPEQDVFPGPFELPDVERQAIEDSKAIFDDSFFGFNEPELKFDEPVVEEPAPLFVEVDEANEPAEEKSAAKSGAAQIEGFDDDFWGADDDLEVSWGRARKDAEEPTVESVEEPEEAPGDAVAEAQAEEEGEQESDQGDLSQTINFLFNNSKIENAEEAQEEEEAPAVVTLENLDPSSPDALEAFFAADVGEESLGFAPRKQQKESKSAPKDEPACEPEPREPRRKAAKAPRDEARAVERVKDAEPAPVAEERDSPAPRERASKQPMAPRQTHARDRRREVEDVEPAPIQPEARPAKRREPVEDDRALEPRRPKRREIDDELDVQEPRRPRRRDYEEEREVVQETRRPRRYEPEDERDDYQEPRRPRRRDYDDEREVVQESRRPRRREDDRDQRGTVAEEPAVEKKSLERLIPSWDTAISFVVDANLKRRDGKHKK